MKIASAQSTLIIVCDASLRTVCQVYSVDSGCAGNTCAVAAVGQGGGQLGWVVSTKLRAIENYRKQKSFSQFARFLSKIMFS